MRIVPTIGMISYDGSRSPARRARPFFSLIVNLKQSIPIIFRERAKRDSNQPSPSSRCVSVKAAAL